MWSDLYTAAGIDPGDAAAAGGSIALAAVIAASRTVDYWHNFDDVVAGAVIGLGCAAVGMVGLEEELRAAAAAADPAADGYVELDPGYPP